MSGWHYAFVHNKELEEFDVYEVYPGFREKGYELAQRPSRTERAIYTLPGLDVPDLVGMLRNLINDAERDNVFDTIEALDNHLGINDSLHSPQGDGVEDE